MDEYPILPNPGVHHMQISSSFLCFQCRNCVPCLKMDVAQMHTQSFVGTSMLILSTITTKQTWFPHEMMISPIWKRCFSLQTCLLHSVMVCHMHACGFFFEQFPYGDLFLLRVALLVNSFSLIFFYLDSFVLCLATLETVAT